MPVNLTGTSVKGFQDLIVKQPSTGFNVQVLSTAQPTVQPRPIGYAFVMVNNTASPFQQQVLARQNVYAPGTFLLFPGTFGSTGTYTVKVNWYQAGILWRCILN